MLGMDATISAKGRSAPNGRSQRRPKKSSNRRSTSLKRGARGMRSSAPPLETLTSLLPFAIGMPPLGEMPCKYVAAAQAAFDLAQILVEFSA